MKPLYERYRPKTWDEVVGQDRIIQELAFLADRGDLLGQVFWITANGGQGKTTIARLLADEVAVPVCQWEEDAQDVTLEVVRQWEDKCQGKPMPVGKDPRRAYAFTVNEAHTLSIRVINRLKTALERPWVQDNSVWCFTTTIAEQAQRGLFDEDKTGSPFLSRAHELVLNHGEDVELSFAIRAQKIAQAEKLDGKSISAYVRLIRDCDGNLRKALQRIARGEMAA